MRVYGYCLEMPCVCLLMEWLPGIGMTLFSSYDPIIISVAAPCGGGLKWCPI